MSTYSGVNARSAECLNSVLNVKALVGAFNQEYEPSDGPFSSSTSDAVTPRERGNERHDVLARHTDTCHTLVTCHVSRVKCHGGGHFVKSLTAPPMLNNVGHAHMVCPSVNTGSLQWVAQKSSQYSFHMVLRLVN